MSDTSFLEGIALVIFDLDHTLVAPIRGGKNPAFRAEEADWHLLPGRVEALRDLRERHIEIGVATNQGGVAFRIHDPAKLATEIWRAASMLGIYYVEFCFCHESSPRTRFRHDCVYRKPGAGMINALISKAHVSRDRTLYVGDRDEDRQAASLANCQFMTTADFFTPYAQMSAPKLQEVPLRNILTGETIAEEFDRLNTWERAYQQYLRSPFGADIVYVCPGCGKDVRVERRQFPFITTFGGLCFDCVDPALQHAHPHYGEERPHVTQEK